MNDNQIIDNAMKWIRYLLMKNYHLNSAQADNAIEASNIRDIYSKDIEMSSHDSIEDWTKEVYKYWKTVK